MADDPKPEIDKRDDPTRELEANKDEPQLEISLGTSSNEDPNALKHALISIAAGIVITPSWYALWDLMHPNPTGLEIKDGVFLSLIPIGLSLFLVLLGIARLVDAWVSSRGARRSGRRA